MQQIAKAFQDSPARDDISTPSAAQFDSQHVPTGIQPSPFHSLPVQNKHERLFRKILVPTDFSPASNKALECAVAVANQCGATLTIFHVININAQATSGAADELMKRLWDQASARMGQLAWSFSGQVDARTT